MSALSTEPLVPLAVLIASLTGSMHCVSMCGGLIVAGARTRSEVARYHLGRLLGYATLGGAAGLVGEHVLISASRGWVGWAGSFLVAFALIALGVRVWKGRALHFSLMPPSWTRKLMKWSFPRPFYLGSVSAFLPCGWLHTFVLAALTTRNPLHGAVFLAAFWAGTLPALVSAPMLIQNIIRPLTKLAPKTTALLLIAAGIGSLALKSKPLLASIHAAGSAEQEPTAEVLCHGSHSLKRD